MIRGDNSRTARALGWFPVSMSFAGFDRVSLLNRHHYRHRAYGLASLSSSRLTRSRSTCSSTSSARRPPAGRRAGRRGRRGRRLRCAVRELGRAAVGRNRRRGHDLAGRDAHVERHRERRIAAGVRRHVVLRADELLALAVARGVASGGSRGRTIASSPVVWPDQPCSRGIRRQVKPERYSSDFSVSAAAVIPKSFERSPCMMTP